jgi:hypothetical protein
MLTWIIKISIASICFIFLVHHLICFLKNTLTIPKTKDLVNSSSEKYNKMCSILEKKTNQENHLNKTIIELDSCTNVDSLPVDEVSNTNIMKEELKFFLKNQLNNNNNLKSENYNITNFDVHDNSGKINYSNI